MTKKILIVDDNEADLLLIKKTIVDAGFDCELIMVKSGEEGLEKIESERPDLIILDILMPKMDGYTFIKMLEAKREAVCCSQDIPIILVTGIEHMKDTFAAEGIKDYIVKPFESGELVEKIAVYLNNSSLSKEN